MERVVVRTLFYSFHLFNQIHLAFAFVFNCWLIFEFRDLIKHVISSLSRLDDGRSFRLFLIEKISVRLIRCRLGWVFGWLSHTFDSIRFTLLRQSVSVILLERQAQSLQRTSPFTGHRFQVVTLDLVLHKCIKVEARAVIFLTTLKAIIMLVATIREEAHCTSALVKAHM